MAAPSRPPAAPCRCSISANCRSSAGLPDDRGGEQARAGRHLQRAHLPVSSGSFGLWGPGSGDLWLDAYVTDFLTRAREQKYDVPEQAMVQALDNLQNALSYDNNVEERGNEIAYALYVLARNRKASISDLRYYADTRLAQFPSRLAKAHIAAALGALWRCAALGADLRRTRSRWPDGVTNVSLVPLRLRLEAARRRCHAGTGRRKRAQRRRSSPS